LRRLGRRIAVMRAIMAEAGVYFTVAANGSLHRIITFSLDRLSRFLLSLQLCNA
jgi:hypothetical protein